MSQVELHYLICHRDFEDFLLSVRTFFYWNPVKWKLVVHSDGSLTKDEINYIRDNFDSRVIDREEADETVLSVLKDYPYCYDWRKNFLNKSVSKNVFLKIFDPMIFCKDYYVLFDSDVFFYDKDEFIINYAENQILFYCGGGWGFLKYPANIEYLQEIGFKPVGNFNGGLIGLKKSMFNLNLIEKFFEIVENNIGKTIPNYGGFCYTGEEEPLLSCLIGLHKHKVIWCGDFDENTPDYAKTSNSKIYGVNSHPNKSILVHYAHSTETNISISFGRLMAKSKMNQGEGK